MRRHASMPIETYRDLDTWQACMTAVEQTYLVTQQFPIEERFGLTSQARRLETCLEIGRCLRYLGQSDFDAPMSVVDRAGELLNGLLRSLESKQP
jgi:23S rRNA-intervening sequence protein